MIAPLQRKVEPCDAEEAFGRVEALLEKAHGQHNAMTLDRITTLAGLPTRRTTEALFENNLDRFPYPLVASSAGYFRPLHARQLNDYIRSLRSRAIKCFLRARTVRRQALKAGWPIENGEFAEPPRQLELFEGRSQESGVRIQNEGRSGI